MPRCVNQLMGLVDLLSLTCACLYTEYIYLHTPSHSMLSGGGGMYRMCSLALAFGDQQPVSRAVCTVTMLRADRVAAFLASLFMASGEDVKALDHFQDFCLHTKPEESLYENSVD